MDNHIITKAYEFEFFDECFVFKQLVHKRIDLEIKYVDIIEFNNTCHSFAFYAPTATFTCNIKNYGELAIAFNLLRKKEWPLLRKAIDQIIERRTELKMKEFEASQPRIEKKKCPFCSCVLKSNSKFCPECGTRIGSASKSKFCPECGTQVEPESRFCSNCGQHINH